MPRYRIVISESRISTRAKVFTAKSLDEAIRSAEADDWRPDNGWEEIDTDTASEVRDELCGPDPSDPGV
jgi:hypothetical protein